MSIATAITAAQQKVAATYTKCNSRGAIMPATQNLANLPDCIGTIPELIPYSYEVEMVLVQSSASSTANVPYNPNLKIYGSDGNLYTIVEWNALFVEAGFDKDQMNVEPVGWAFKINENNKWEVIQIVAYSPTTFYKPNGTRPNTRGISHTPDGGRYSCWFGETLRTFVDDTTNKQVVITDNGDGNCRIYVENTKTTFYQPIIVTNNFFLDSGKTDKFSEAYYQYVECARHRFAISSGVSTTQDNGTIAQVLILNANGEQAGLNEDMYFWLYDDNNLLVNTNVLAKYNLSCDTSGVKTTFNSDTVYSAQKAAGINMNDTGLNSSTIPILSPGLRGAEAVAVDGVWMIMTPLMYGTNGFADAPAIYYARLDGWDLPSHEVATRFCATVNVFLNKYIQNYFNSIEGRNIPRNYLVDDYNFWLQGRNRSDYAPYIHWNVYTIECVSGDTQTKAVYKAKTITIP